ncbi:TRAP transporter substrate-binding protein DctP [Chloroflexota bacterium]
MNKFRLVYLGLAICLIASMLAFACGGPAPKETITLKAITFIPVDNPMVKGGWIFSDLVNERSNGELIVDFIGGPEIIPGGDQPMAVMQGTIDIVYNVTAYSAPLVPEGDVLHLSQYLPWEERENGAYDWFVETFKKMNSYYLGRMMTPNAGFFLWTKKSGVERPADLAGQKMRTGALYDEFMRGLGIVPVNIAVPDTYSALEQGIVDGFGQPIPVAWGMRWTEKCEYLIDHEFYNQNGQILINLDVWNKLPKHLQDLMKEAAAEQERLTWDFFEELIAKQRVEMKDAGVQFIKFSPADAKYYLDLAYSTSWEVTKQKVDPTTYTKLEQLLRK